MSIVISILTVVLILISIFLVLVVLMQKAKSDGAVAAMGGGSMESTFGAETGNVLTKATINAAIAFFVISFALYILHIRQSKQQEAADSALPKVAAPAGTPATPAANPTAPAPTPKT
jgi:preprotein translocase subunit SecG